MKSFSQTPKELKIMLELLDKEDKNIKRVINATKEIGPDFEIHARSKTVEESVKHTPLTKNRIIKTLVFKAGNDFIAVMCPGNKRVDENKLAKITEKTIRMARPEEVKSNTGYIVGGVSPFDLDIDLYAAKSIPKGDVRPAGGSQIVGVKTTRSDLFNLVNPKIVQITE